MKKIAIGLSIILGMTFTGCNNTTTELKSKNESIESSQVENESSKEYLSAGDVFLVESELGDYEFKIIEATYLGPHDGDSNKFERVQVAWEVNNISFNGWEEDASGNKIEEGFCQVPAQALKVKDDNNYILDEMSTGWDGDFSNEDKKVYVGEKIIQKYTWILNDKDTENLYVSFSRMGNKEYKIKINKQ